MDDRGRWLGVVARVVPAALMVVLGCTGNAAAAIGTPGFVGSFGSQTTATSTSVTLGGAIPVGETLIVTVALEPVVGTASCGDSAGGGTWTVDADVT